jgi:purine-binding chemotaxis protein CheW
MALTAEQIRPAPEFGASFDSRYLTGIGALEQRMLILIDMERLLTNDDFELAAGAVQ